MTTEKSCGTIIILNNQVLLIKQNSGIVGFPKGHMLPSESEVETAIRETKEETNIDVLVDKTKRYPISYPKSEKIIKEVVYFLATPTDGFVVKKQDSEIADTFWVDMDKVRETLTYDNLRELWDNVLKDLK
jgi:8-oxo-dGTP pyrophosphatase MutT (NUDIX family)